MVAYSFQRQFIGPIQAGTKVQTIRAVGKRRHASVGCQLQIYFAMRTQHCRKIIDDQVCTRVDSVMLDMANKQAAIQTAHAVHYLTSLGDLDRFAVLDGFENWEAMVAFWTKFHPDLRLFNGVMPGWRPGFWEL